MSVSSVELQQFRAEESMKQWFPLRNVPCMCCIKTETSWSQAISPLKGKLVLGVLHGLGVQQSQRLEYQEKFNRFFSFRLGQRKWC